MLATRFREPSPRGDYRAGLTKGLVELKTPAQGSFSLRQSNGFLLIDTAYPVHKLFLCPVSLCSVTYVLLHTLHFLSI